jgi:hypothetical protein
MNEHFTFFRGRLKSVGSAVAGGRHPVTLVSEEDQSPHVVAGNTSTTFRLLLRVPRILRPRVVAVLIALSGLEFGCGRGLAGVICGMLAVAVWAWNTRPIPSPYDHIPYDPNDPKEGF